MADNIDNGTPNPGFMAPLTRVQSPIMLPLMFPAEGETAVVPGADGGTPNTNTNGAPPVNGVGGTNGGNNQTPTEKTFSFKEDRSDWVPRTRLNEVSGKLTNFERENLTLKDQLALAEKRTRALAGVEPTDPKAAETNEVREAIQSMFPQLKALENLTGDQLQQVLQAAQEAQNTSHSIWSRHAKSMIADLESEAARVLETDKLSPTQQKQIQRAYREEGALSVKEREAAIRRGERDTLDTLSSDTDFLARHEAGDKSLLKEFVKAFLDDWFEPAKKSVTAAQARRNRPLPSGSRARVPVTTGAAQVNLGNDADFKKALIAARTASAE